MRHNTIIIDKIEKNVICCEDFFTGEIIEINCEDVLGTFQEGDVLTLDQANSKYSIDLEKTIKRKIEVKMKFDSIWDTKNE